MKTEHHHIQRHAGTPPPNGSGACLWSVRWYDGEGKRRVKTFADSKHGGTEAALKAAIEFRDHALAEAAELRDRRIRENFIPALTPKQRQELRARMIDADCRGDRRHFRLRVPTGEAQYRQVLFPFRKYGGNPRRAFNAALRFRDRIEQLSYPERRSAFARMGFGGTRKELA